MKSFATGVCSLLLSYHALGILLLGLLPSKSKLYRQVQPYFSWYLKATGTQQSWAMFTTIPYHHKQKIIVEVIDSAGNKMENGDLMPDLAPYDSTYFRYHTSLSRMRNKKYRRYMKAYAANVKAKLEEQYQTSISSVTVRYQYQTIRKLYKIRKNGVISTPKEYKSGPFTWSE